MNLKQLATLKNAYDRRNELREFEKHLKENPLQESEYNQLLDNANLTPRDRMDFNQQIKTLKNHKMIIDDIPEPFEDFSARSEKQGKIAIKSSTMKQMSSEEFAKLTTKKMALYDDVNGRDKVQHFRYKDRNGYVRETGKGISVNISDTNDIEAITNAHRTYKNAKKEIGAIMEEIDVNGDKYANFNTSKSPMEKFNEGKEIG